MLYNLIIKNMMKPGSIRNSIICSTYASASSDCGGWLFDESHIKLLFAEKTGSKQLVIDIFTYHFYTSLEGRFNSITKQLRTHKWHELKSSWNNKKYTGTCEFDNINAKYTTVKAQQTDRRMIMKRMTLGAHCPNIGEWVSHCLRRTSRRKSDLGQIQH